MPTREEFYIAQQVLHYLSSCQRDLVANAASYKTELAASTRRLTDAQLAAIAQQDGTAITRLLDQVDATMNDVVSGQMVRNGLASLGVDMNVVVADCKAFRAAANAQASGITTLDAATVQRVADATLSAVPPLTMIQDVAKGAAQPG